MSPREEGELKSLTIVARVLIATCCLAACKDMPGADGRYAHMYPGHSGEGGTGLPSTPYDPNWRDKVR